MRIKQFKYFFFVLVFLSCSVFSNNNAFAASAEKDDDLNLKDLIFGHILNAHEWHIADYKGKHISIPLPIIVRSQERGWFVFMSSRFDHGHKEHKGFSLHTSGPYKGKITETNSKGEIVLPLDFSITKHAFGVFFSLALMCWVFLTVAKRYKENPLGVPRGKQSLLEPIILFVKNDIAKNSIGEKHHERFVPFLLTVFFFILINNLMGLLPIFPGGGNVTGDISITMSLAFMTFVVTQVSGNKDYWKHVYDTPGIPWFLKYPIPIIPVIEFVGLFNKPFTLMIRLFANITAGHMITLAFFSLIFIFGQFNVFIGYGTSIMAITFTIFMTVLEILVAFIQAYVFTLLSAIFFGMATAEHEDHH